MLEAPGGDRVKRLRRDAGRRVHHRGTEVTEKTDKSSVFKGLYLVAIYVSVVRFWLESASIGDDPCLRRDKCVCG